MKRYAAPMLMAFAALAAAPETAKAQADAPPRKAVAGDSFLANLDACGLDFVGCVQGAARAGAPLRVGGCRREFAACRGRAAGQGDGPVLECRRTCMKAWNSCRADATPAFIDRKRECAKEFKACSKLSKDCWRKLTQCEEARKGLDACIDGRARCEQGCAAAGALVAIP